MLGCAAWLALFGDKRPAGEAVDLARPPAASVAPTVPPAGAGRKNVQRTEPPAIEMLVPRKALVSSAASAPADIFASRNWAPPPPVVAVSAPPTPVAPPLPYVYLGKKFEDGAWEVYLGRGELSFVVRAGMDLEGLYRVVEIQPTIMTLKYQPLGEQQLLAIGESQ